MNTINWKKMTISFLGVLPVLIAVLFSLSAVSGRAEEKTDSAAGNKPEVRFSLESGAYRSRSEYLTLETEPGFEIRYTLDGSLPSKDSAKYKKPILLSRKNAKARSLTESADLMYLKKTALRDDSGLPRACVVRAAAFTPDGTAGNIRTHTYFMGMSLREKYAGAPVISIVTDPENLLDYDKGILVRGRVWDEWKDTEAGRKIIASDQPWFYETNYMQRGKEWERPASIEIFDGTEEPAVSQGVGIRIHGGASRVGAQRGFNLYFREAYGKECLDYELIPDAANRITGSVIGSFKFLMLRNGGNEAERMVFKDRMFQDLLKDRNCATQAGRLAVLFLNGEYWGVYTLQEKYSARYFEDHYGIPRSEVILIEEGRVEEGREDDIRLYQELMSFADRDLSDPDEWARFCGAVDTDSMADYYAIELYIANADWREDKNIRLWRARTPGSGRYEDGRWRYALFDLEYSAGLYGQEMTAAEFDSVSYAMEQHALFRAAMRNESFRTKLKEAIISLGTGEFSESGVLSAQERYTAEWAPYMPDHYKRFGDTSSLWDSSARNMTAFFSRRLQYILKYFRQAQMI